jgi:hypothetical protein
MCCQVLTKACYPQLYFVRLQPSEIYRHVVLLKFTDFSYVRTDSIISTKLGCTPIWNVGILQGDYVTQYPRRLLSPYPPPWKPEISYVRSDVLTAVKAAVMLSLAPYRFVGRQRFGGIYYLCHFHSSPEDGNSNFLQNVGIHLRIYTAPKPKPTSSSNYIFILFGVCK